MKHTVFASGDVVARATSNLFYIWRGLLLLYVPKQSFTLPILGGKDMLGKHREKENILEHLPIPSLRPKTIKNIRYTIGKILFGETQRKREKF